MIPMRVILNGDNAWPDLKEKPEQVVEPVEPMQVALLEGGMASGRPSVTLRIDLPDGRVVLAQTSARLFCLAGRAFVARCPDLFEGD